MSIRKQTGVPQCPGCGAKFSHDQEKAECRVCGLPDEVLDAGPKAVARWRRKPYRVTATSGGVHVMEPLEQPQARGGSVHRRRRAHGRARGAPRRAA